MNFLRNSSENAGCWLDIKPYNYAGKDLKEGLERERQVRERKEH